MGSQLCPGSAKQIIQELQIENGQKSYELLFKGCLNIRQNKVNELLFQQEQHHYHPQPLNRQESSQHLSENNQILPLVQSQPIQKLENATVQIIFQDGAQYKGQVKDGIPHGEGEQITSFGHYKGFFHEGVKQGYGVYQYSNKQKYQGQFKQNMIWGKGTYTFANGDSYQGQFIRNERSGKGRYIFKNGNQEQNLYFQGEYKNDLKQGRGTLKRVNYDMIGIWRCGLYEFHIDNEFIK